MGQSNRRQITVSVKARQRLKQWRLQAQMSISDLSGQATLSERTLRDLERTTPPRACFREETLIDIAAVFNRTLDELLRGSSSRVASFALPTRFDELAEKLHAVDKRLLEIIRDLINASSRAKRETYLDLVQARLQKEDIDWKVLQSHLHDPQFLLALKQNGPERNLLVKVEKQFKTLEFICSPENSLSIENPELLWDCHCDTPGAEQAKESCPIHSHPLGDEVTTRFRAGSLQIQYRGMKFWWKSEHGDALWPPSVDAFYAG